MVVVGTEKGTNNTYNAIDISVWTQATTQCLTRGKMNDMMLARRRKTVNDATTEHDMMNVERTVDAKR